MSDLHSIVSQEQIDAEKLFIGSVVRTPQGLQGTGWLEPEAFMVPAHKTFWEKVKAGEDPLTVVMSTPDLTKALSWSNEALAFKVSEYASALANRVYLRTSLEYAEQVAALVQDDDVQGVQRLIAQQATMLPAGASNMRTPLEIAMSLNKRIDAGNVSIPWGIASLDGATMGSERGTLTLLAARPSMGKSSLAFQCNEHQALVQELKVGVFALEMSGEQMFARRTCHKVGATWMEVRSENVSVTQREQLKGYVIDYAEEIDGYLYVNDSTHTTSTDIIRTQLREKFDVIMIDHLTLLKDKPWRGERHDQKLGRISMAMHELAKNTNCVVLLLAQLNRNLEQRQDKRPTMADLRDSGELEQNADNVALIYGEWYYDPQADNITEINFGKYRDGVKDRTAYVKFNKSDQQFDSVTQKELDEMSEEEMEQAHETEGGHTQINAQQEIPF